MVGLIQVAVPNHLGDAVMALPQLHRIAHALPATRLRLVGRALPAKVLDGQGPWSPVSPKFERARTGGALLLAPSFRVAWQALCAGAKLRIGTATDARGLLLTRRVHASIERIHQREVYAAAVDALFDELGLPSATRGAKAATCPNVPGLVLPENEGHPATDVLIHPWAAGDSAKRWPVARWTELARRIEAELGCSVTVTGGPGGPDADLAHRVAAAIGGTALAGEASLSPLSWAALARGCRLLILPDTGLAHLASEAGCRPLVLFGGSDPARYAPARASVIDAAAMEAITTSSVLQHAVEELRL